MKQNWARKALGALDAVLLPHSAERNELLLAAVRQAQVTSLYPFNIRDYRAGARRALGDGRSLALSQGFHLAQVEWTLSRWLPRTVSEKWETEISKARDSARTRARSTGSLDPVLLKPRVKLLTEMYLLPGLLHELQRYPFEGEQRNDAARTKLESQIRHLHRATGAMVVAAQQGA